MKGFAKCLIAAAILVGAGIALLLIGLGVSGWKLNPEITEKTYIQSSENIKNISLDIAAGEFETVFYDGEKIEIDYFTSTTKKVEIKESGTTLTYRESNRWWINFIGFKYPKVVIKLPQSNIYNLDVDMSAGIVSIAGGTFGNLDVDMSAGMVKFNDSITCGKLNIDISAGKIEADKIDCSSLKVNVSAGAVEIDEIICPVIDIGVSAGSVNLGIDGIKSEYTIRVDKSAGSCNVNNQTGTDSAKKIDIDVSAGSVNVRFTD